MGWPRRREALRRRRRCQSPVRPELLVPAPAVPEPAGAQRAAQYRAHHRAPPTPRSGRAQASVEGLESAVGAEEHEEGWRGGKTRRGEAGGHGV